MQILAIALGGAVGAVSRYWVMNMSGTIWGMDLGLAIVNIIGSFALGVVVVLFASLPNHSILSAALLIGFLGAFTTFSTFVYDCVRLFQSNQASAALGTVLMHQLLGILAILAGLWLGKFLIR